MKLKLIRRSIVLAAAASAALSSSAMAEDMARVMSQTLVSTSVRLTDLELDAITAGSALSFVVVVNRGSGPSDGFAGNGAHHLTQFVAAGEGKTFTLHVVANRANPSPSTLCHGHC